MTRSRTCGPRASGLPRRGALLRRVRRGSGVRRRSASYGGRGGRGCRRAVRHQRRNAAAPPGRHRQRRRRDRPARRHPRAQRRRLRRRQLARRCARRCDARAGHGERLRRALRQRRSVQHRRGAGGEGRPRGAAAGTAGRARTGGARRGRGREHRAGPAPAVGRASAFAHKAGLHVSAIKADPDLYQHTDPGGRRQRHAAARVRAGRSRDDRAEGPGPRPRAGPRDGRSCHRAGQGPRVRRLLLRGRGGVVRAAAARGDGAAAAVLRPRVVARDRGAPSGQ